MTLLLQLPDIGLVCPFYFYLGEGGGECSVCKVQKRASDPPPELELLGTYEPLGVGVGSTVCSALRSHLSLQPPELLLLKKA